MEQTFQEERYVVKLDVFEGPLDLLLHLVRKHELDIFDVPMAFITEKYLEYLDLMKQLNLDLASDYLEMAATLVLIKSRMLLPAEPADDEDLPEYGPDPREELIRRLLEYQKYKIAAENLANLPRLGRDTFPRGASEQITVEREIQAPSLFALMEAFQRILNHADAAPVHEVSVNRITVAARINQLVDIMRTKDRITFLELFEDQRTRTDIVVTFLSLLEMVKIGLTRLHQAGIHADIHITATTSMKEAEQILATELVEE